MSPQVLCQFAEVNEYIQKCHSGHTLTVPTVESEGNRLLTWGKFGNRFSGETAEIELLRDGNIVKVQTTLKTPVRLVCSNSLNLLLHRTWGQCSTLVQLNVPPSTISNPKHCDIYTRWNSTICALGTKNYCVLMRENFYAVLQVPVHIEGKLPSYLIVAGLVFTSVCHPYLEYVNWPYLPTYPSKIPAFKGVAFLQILNLSQLCFSCRSEYGSEFEYDAPVSFAFNFPVCKICS
jgi:hypothetical protein